MMKDDEKNIKKIDEFIINNKFPFGEDNRNLSKDEIDNERIISNSISKKNAAEMGIVPKKPNIDINSYRDRIYSRKKRGECEKTDDELDEYCIDRFGEPFFKK